MVSTRATFVGMVLLGGALCWGAPLVPTPPTQALLDANPGLRGMIHGEHLIALFGVPFASDSDPQTSTDQFVEAFLAQHADALGVNGVTLALESKVNIRNDKFTVYTYIQKIEDLPVHGSVVKIPVLLGETERIGYIGMRLVHLPEDPLPGDVISASEAIAVVAGSAQYGHLTTFSTPELVIYEAKLFDGALHRTWRFSGSGDHESYLFLVDTNTADLVGVIDQIWWADLSGTVTGYATPCCHPDRPDWPDCCPSGEPDCCCLPDDPDYPACAFTCCATDVTGNPERYPTELALGGVQVGIIGGATTNADDNGVYLFGDLAEGVPVDVESRLIGQWVTVRNHYIGPGDDLVVTDVFTPPDPDAHLLFNQAPGFPDWPSTYDTAQVNAFVALQETHDWFNGILDGTPSPIDMNLPCYVNSAWEPQGMVCWAGCYIPYSPMMIITEVDRPSCRNGAFSTLLSHEYGHFIVHQVTGIGVSDDPLVRAFHEGSADTVAALMWDTQCMAYEYAEWNTCYRDVDSPNVMLGESGGAHYRGRALSGAFWDLRKLIGDRATEELFADFLSDTDGYLDESILVEVLTADDDDGNLSNGTPHSEDICVAFVGLHGWSPGPCVAPGGDVEVSWLGPVPPFENPEEGTDYVVDYDIYPPSVTLKTTEKGGEPVLRWSVGRVHPETGEPLDLGTISADWDGNPHDIIVWVGVDAERPCRNLHVVQIPAQTLHSDWSSIQLNLTGNLYGLARCYADSNGDGGRISGQVDRDASSVYAEAIGVGSSDPANLEVADALVTTVLGSIPSGSTLVAGNLDGRLVTTDVLSGTVDIRGDVTGTVTVNGTGESTGSILVQGDIQGAPFSGSTISIHGDMSGDILADADGDGEGAITGIVRVWGVFNGNICGSNLGPGQPLPDNIQFGTVGPDATVCDGMVIICGALYIGPDGGAWQDEDNWEEGQLPNSATVACIPTGKTIRVEFDEPTHPKDVEAKAIHVVGAAQPGDPCGTLILESSTSLTIHEDSTIAGQLIMEHGSTLYVADDLTIIGNGGQIDGFYDSGQGQEPPLIRDIDGGSATLTLQGVGTDRESSLVVRGGLEIQVALDNNAYVVADDLDPLLLSVNPKTTSVWGHWVAEHHPVDTWAGELSVDVEVTGVGSWSLVDDADARITINAACVDLGGVLELTQGALYVAANFWTSGNLLMQSVNGSAPRIEIAAGRSSRFGN